MSVISFTVRGCRRGMPPRAPTARRGRGAAASGTGSQKQISPLPRTSQASVHRAYANIDGYGIAETKEQQREEGVFLDGIQFGEVRPESFLTALGWCDPQPGESFIDLGAARGRQC